MLTSKVAPLLLSQPGRTAIASHASTSMMLALM
jgi:hypothetical protein